jgi:hypothetical protein
VATFLPHEDVVQHPAESKPLLPLVVVMVAEEKIQTFYIVNISVANQPPRRSIARAKKRMQKGNARASYHSLDVLCAQRPLPENLL